MSCKIRTRKVRGFPVVQVAGDLTGEHVGRVAECLERLRNGDAPVIVVDLSETSYIDSHGLGAFVYCWRLMENEKRSLVFVSPQGSIQSMFQNTNLDRIFRVVGSLDDV